MQLHNHSMRSWVVALVVALIGAAGLLVVAAPASAHDLEVPPKPTYKITPSATWTASSGREAIIIVGETDQGFAAEGATNPAPKLEAAYRKLGFGVQIVQAPADEAPIKAALTNIQNAYPTIQAPTLDDVLVHYAGHGAQTKPGKLGWMSITPKPKQTWELSPKRLGEMVGSAFPSTTLAFASTDFWAVFDGCSIYAAVDTFPTGVTSQRANASGAVVTAANKPGLWSKKGGGYNLCQVGLTSFSHGFATSLSAVANPGQSVHRALHTAARTAGVKNWLDRSGQFVVFG